MTFYLTLLLAVAMCCGTAIIIANRIACTIEILWIRSRRMESQTNDKDES